MGNNDMEVKATLKKPFSEEERLSFIVENNHNNGWEIKETDTELQALGYSDIEAVRSSKLAELLSLKNNKLLEFSYANKVFQIDTESKLNISGKVSEIMLKTQLGQEVDGINWIAKDNTIKTFSKEEFLAFAIAVATHTEAVIFKHDQLRTAVNNATSIDEIKAIEWVD